MIRLEGLAVSPGLIEGEVVIFSSDTSSGSEALQTLSQDPKERWSQVKQLTIHYLGQLAERLSVEAGKSAGEIFLAHQMMADDPNLEESVISRLSQGIPLCEAIDQTVEKLAQDFESLDNDYMRERAQDIRDIGKHLHDFAQGKTSDFVLDRPAVLAASDLTPSQTASLNKRNLLGMLLEKGSRTSHTAILARSLGIPAVVAIPDLLRQIHETRRVIVDGESGKVILDPDQKEVAHYQARMDDAAKTVVVPEATVRTKDGMTVGMAANIGSVQEAEQLGKFGLCEVGLCRTEFILLEAKQLPDEESQRLQYKRILEAVAPHPVVFRTFDIGGDKQLPYLKLESEANPFLGLRGLRLLLANPGLFKTQLRALLRASVHGKMKVMLPMVSTLEELDEAMGLVTEVKAELSRENHPYASDIEWGIMIEVPAAALLSGELAPKVDFFSIGTNDLIQYTLAVDRMNSKLNSLYQPCHPGVLRLIHEVVQAARISGKPVCVCGEMAGTWQTVPLLLGLGITELSMSPVAAPRIRQGIMELVSAKCTVLADQALRCKTEQSVHELLETMKMSLSSIT